MNSKMSYRDAGVDIAKANSFVERIKPIVKATTRKEVMGSIGGFGGLFNLDTSRFKKPVLVSSTDGVGTKLRIAQLMDRHDTIGIDLVAMSVNDIVVQGAEPLFFLDYLATGRIDTDRHVQIIQGIANGCQEAGCALIGGETAEMPGFYRDNEYDLAGFAVGIVDEEKLIDGSDIRDGDRIIGVSASGLHSNGYSLARKILLDQGGVRLDSTYDGLTGTIGEELLRPTKIYVRPVLNLLKNFAIKGIVHVTGGGFIDNIPRIIPNSCRAVIYTKNWDIPAIFRIIQDMGNVDTWEMYRVFNMGIGLMLIIAEANVAEAINHLSMLGQRAYLIGHIEIIRDQQPQVVLA